VNSLKNNKNIMPFSDKDERINTKGRPKGSLNKTTKQIKLLIRDLFDENTEYLYANLDQMTISERINLSKTLLPFLMPKLQSVVLREGESIDHFKAIEIKFNDEN
jgi:hypothetical protein